jgi:hypothetical protein
MHLCSGPMQGLGLQAVEQSGYGKLTLRYLAEGEIHPRELDWVAIQRLRQARGAPGPAWADTRGTARLAGNPRERLGSAALKPARAARQPVVPGHLGRGLVGGMAHWALFLRRIGPSSFHWRLSWLPQCRPRDASSNGVAAAVR